MCAKLYHATDTCQAVVYLIDSIHQLLHCSCSRQWCKHCKAFELAAVGDNGNRWSKTAMTLFLMEYYITCRTKL